MQKRLGDVDGGASVEASGLSVDDSRLTAVFVVSVRVATSTGRLLAILAEGGVENFSDVYRWLQL